MGFQSCFLTLTGFRGNFGYLSVYVLDKHRNCSLKSTEISKLKTPEWILYTAGLQVFYLCRILQLEYCYIFIYIHLCICLLYISFYDIYIYLHLYLAMAFHHLNVAVTRSNSNNLSTHLNNILSVKG